MLATTKPTSPKALLDAIAAEAQKLWGEDWFAELVRRYCEIEAEMTGTKPLARTRRSSLERAIKTGGCSLETGCWLAAAIGAELQMAVHRVEIMKL